MLNFSTSGILKINERIGRFLTQCLPEVLPIRPFSVLATLTMNIIN